MKKITVFDLFLVFAIILNIGGKNIYSSMMLLLAGLLEMIDVVPRIIRQLKEVRHGGK